MMHYYASDQAHVFWDEVIDAVVIRWNAFAMGEEFRDPLDKLIELAVIKKAKKALFDSSHILVLKEDAKWLSEEWFPRLLDAGIEYAATVIPEQSVPLAGTGKNTSRRTTNPLRHNEFRDIHNAVGWLSGIPA